MKPIYSFRTKHPVYTWGEKYYALLRQGYTEDIARRMATNLEKVYTL